MITDACIAVELGSPAVARVVGRQTLSFRRFSYVFMRIFVYEHIVGGGLIAARAAGTDETLGALVDEARAMLMAVVADLRAADGLKPSWLVDADLFDAAMAPYFTADDVTVSTEAERAAEFDRLAAACDFTLLIAPETDGILAGLAHRVVEVGGRLASPSTEFIAWAADKHQVCETLREAGINAPSGLKLGPDDRWPKHFLAPAVLKSIDGCGSTDIRRLSETRQDARGESRRIWRLERFVAGQAASVALLRGEAGIFPLPACSQRIKDDGRFEYLGGTIPLAEDFAARARKLALAAAAAMPDWTGYVGFDLVLGAGSDGSDDFVIEVNPRLTTSYIGLRAIAEKNLAQAMIDVVAGHTPQLAFRNEAMEFDTAGNVTRAGSRVMALDIGGANLKASDGAEFVRSRPFPLWRNPTQLATELAALLADAPTFPSLTVTMTGELADCFRTKQEGVATIVDAVVEAFPDHAAAGEIRVFLTDGSFALPDEAKQRWNAAAASNWLATAIFAAEQHAGQAGVLIDIGSTTTDVIPFTDGVPCGDGRTDSDRLTSGELVYTGVVRSPICAVVPRLPLHGRLCGVAQELFATTRDAYLLLDQLAEDATDTSTADGRPATKEFALERLARMVCADRESFDLGDARQAAIAVLEAQVRLISAAVDRVVQRLGSEPELFVVCGQGEFLAREVLKQRRWSGEVVSLAAELGPAASIAGPAYALARLANG